MVSQRRGETLLTGDRLVVALGSWYVLLGVATAIVPTSHDESLSAVLVTVAFVAGSGLVLVVGGHRLSRTAIEPAFFRDVFWRTIAGVGVMLMILALYHFQPDSGLTDPSRSIPILTAFSAVAGYFVGISDARAKTRARQLERQNDRLERTQERLEASNERLEQFAYADSHDLQEPLRMITSYLQLLENRYADDFDEDGEEFVAYAVDGAERMRAMIDGLLEYSRVETQGDPFEPVALEDVLADVCRDLELRIEESDATITAGDLPRVKGDRRQLRQLFQNLLSNAIEYSGDEPPRIEIEADRRGDDWRISVHDQGIGIDPAEQERIFDVFQRLHSHEEQPGTGIGLALCDRIVERHGGEIRVDSEPGTGTTVTVTLPAVSSGATASPVDTLPE